MRKMAFSWKSVGLLFIVFEMVVKATFVGAPQDSNVTDPYVKDALQWAVSEYNRRSNEGLHREVTKVIKAQEQAVSGIKYIFRVIMRSTTCKLGRVCTIYTDPNWAKAYICDFEVWSQSWVNFTQLVKNDCRISH